MRIPKNVLRILDAFIPADVRGELAELQHSRATVAGALGAAPLVLVLAVHQRGGASRIGVGSERGSPKVSTPSKVGVPQQSGSPSSTPHP